MPLSSLETRSSLILRLPDARDLAAWDEFVAVYGPLVYRLARKRGLQPPDADDLVQDVLAAVARSIGPWLERPDRGRFRPWLFCIARNTAMNFLRGSKCRPQPAGGSDAAEALSKCAAHEAEPDNFDLEYRQEVFRWASRCVRDAIAERTWRAFWDTTMEDRPIPEVAEDLGMTAGNVYLARSRVMSRLRQLVQQFEENKE